MEVTQYGVRVLPGAWVYVAALAASFTVATVASPAGVSGALLLLPFQVGVLGTPSPSVTPTNLLYNVVAVPGALYRYWRQGQTGGRLTRLLVLGTLPGVVIGSIIRVDFLRGATSFDVVIASVLIPLGVWLLIAQKPLGGSRWAARISGPALVVVAALVGCVGGIYGWRRGDPRSNPDRIRTLTCRGCTCHPSVHLRYFGRWCVDLAGALNPPSRLDRT